MKFKQITSVVLSLCLLLTCTMSAFAMEENSAKESDKPKYAFSVVAEKNDKLMAEMLKSHSNAYTRTDIFVQNHMMKVILSASQL